MDIARFSRKYAEALRYMAVGKHGTPQWNPTPHPEADPAVVANRDSDPLWQYHRNLRDYSGNMPKSPMWPEGPNGYSAVHKSSTGGHSEAPTLPLPIGMITHAEARQRFVDHQAGVNNDADMALSTDPDGFGLTNLVESEQSNHSNVKAQRELWNFHGTGRRPWYKTLFALQDLGNFAAAHDPYRLLAHSVKSGNRHALPELVDLLQKRDNPAGWYSGWSALAKAMEERVGDLPLTDVLRRADAISQATAQHSDNPHEHHQLATAAREGGDPTGYLAMADHMQENGLPQYAQLLKSELANVIPSLRKQPRRKGSRI